MSNQFGAKRRRLLDEVLLGRHGNSPLSGQTLTSTDTPRCRNSSAGTDELRARDGSQLVTDQLHGSE
jgi:hypothetical protein